MKNKLNGLGVALITPFKEDNSIDEAALSKVVQHVIDGGADFLVALGTTSEAPTLKQEEKYRVLEIIKKTNKGKLPIVLGLGGNNTEALIADMQNYDLNGIDAFLSVTPYYNKPNQAGLKAHFEALAQASPLPIILYNVPGRTACNMLPTTTINLANNHENIIAIKEASGNIVQGMELVKNAAENFIILSGDDDLVMPQMALGFDGVISVIGNAYPKAFKEMIVATQDGNLEKARNLHYQLLPLIDLLFMEGNPVGVKAAMEHLGICEEHVRLPLVKASKDLKTNLEKCISLL